MARMTRIVYVTIACVFMGFASSAGDSIKKDYYKRGLKAKQQGDVQKALMIWGQARKKTTDSRKIDARIGFSYIGTVTEQKLHDHYEQASLMYFWALDATNLRKNFEAVEDELERLQPLFDGKEYRRLRRLLKSGNRSVMNEIRGYWLKNDPTPDEDYNERLLEHWERIAFSRKHFDENSVTVYETDDRAKIYIKYGPPDYVKEGVLKFNFSDVKSWVRELTRLGTHRRSSLFSGSTQSSVTGQGGNSNVQSEFGNSRFFETEAVSEEISRQVRQYFMNPKYSIWVYRGLNEDPFSNVIYIFGEPGDGGRFGLRRSVEDFIPKRAFRPVNRLGSTSITPAILLQLMIYDELSIADPFFGDAFRSLESSIFNISNPVSSQLAFKQRAQSEFKLAEFKATAPADISLYEKTMPRLELHYRQYRMLDDNNNPYLLVNVSTYPQEAFITSSAVDLANRRNIENYLLTYTAQIRDESYNLLEEKKVSPDFNNRSYNINEMKKNRAVSSLIRIPYVSETAFQSLSATLENPELDRSINPNTYPTTLKGMGKVNMTQPEVLSTDESVLEMGDVILGYRLKEQEAPLDFPFQINVFNEVPTGENLMIHFEIYHLQLGGGETGKFQMEYRVRSAKSGNLISTLFGREDEGDVGLTLNFETAGSMFREEIEIETQKLDEGQYQLELKAVDLVSGQEVTRQVDFSVVEEQ